MLNTTVLPRRGRTDVNVELDQLVGETGWLTTDQLSDLIATDGVLGTPETEDAPSSGPVGRWIVAQLQAVGVDAVAYSWVANLAVYGPGRVLLGEVHVPHTHTLAELDAEVNDLTRPELTWQGETDPR